MISVMLGVRRSMIESSSAPLEDDAPATPARLPGQEARGVLEEDHGNVVEVAEADEARALARRVDVDLARGHGRVVGDEADHVAADAAEGRDQVARPRGCSSKYSPWSQICCMKSVMSRGAFMPAGRVEGAAEEDVLLDGEAVDRIRGLAEGRQSGCCRAGRRAGAIAVTQRAELVGRGEVAHAVQPCTPGPPRSSALTSSPSTTSRRPGPVSPMKVPSAWIMNEPWRGR